jgi:hypothetical protein
MGHHRYNWLIRLAMVHFGECTVGERRNASDGILDSSNSHGD